MSKIPHPEEFSEFTALEKAYAALTVLPRTRQLAAMKYLAERLEGEHKQALAADAEKDKYGDVDVVVVATDIVNRFLERQEENQELTADDLVATCSEMVGQAVKVARRPRARRARK